MPLSFDTFNSIPARGLRRTMRYWWKHLIWCHSRVRTRFPLAERGGADLAAADGRGRAGGGRVGARGGRPGMDAVNGVEGGAALLGLCWGAAVGAGEGVRRIGREAKEVTVMASVDVAWPPLLCVIKWVNGWNRLSWVSWQVWHWLFAFGHWTSRRDTRRQELWASAALEHKLCRWCASSSAIVVGSSKLPPAAVGKHDGAMRMRAFKDGRPSSVSSGWGGCTALSIDRSRASRKPRRRRTMLPKIPRRGVAAGRWSSCLLRARLPPSTFDGAASNSINQSKATRASNLYIDPIACSIERNLVDPAAFALSVVGNGCSAAGGTAGPSNGCLKD